MEIGDEESVSNDEDQGNEEGESEEDSPSDEDEEIDKQTADEIVRLKDVLLTNPYSYDDYIKLIKLLRTAGELEDVRHIREDFANRFPLAPSIWLEWIADEQRVATTGEEKQSVVDLFDRAVQDYVSVDLWLEYCQFMMSMMELENGISKVREVVSKAISFVGLDASKGSMIWSFWIEFEKALLQLETTEDGKQRQIRIILDIYRRMLRIPMISMEQTFQEFNDFVDTVKDVDIIPDIDRIKSDYDTAMKKLQTLIPFEDAILKSESTSQRDEYLKYIDYAESKCDPATVQTICERAVNDHCLDGEVWSCYIDFVESKLKAVDVSRKVLHRATRNCPWSSALWIKYLRCSERYSIERNEVIKVFETALKAGLPTGSDFHQLWTAYLDYTRRVTDFKNEKDVASIRRSFVMAADHLVTIPDADPNFSILQYSAKVEAAHLNSMDIAREIWNNMMEQPTLSCQAQLWVEYYNLERLHGDITHAKEVLSRGLKLCWDWPETLGQLLIKLEREEGSNLADYEEALKKYEKTMKRVNKRREADQAKSQVVPQKQGKKVSDTSIASRKRKPEPSKADDTFKVPEIPSKVAKKDNEVAPKEEQPHYVKPKDARDKGNDLQTVFVSNLDFSVDDEKLKEVFSQFGPIVDVRLVRNFKGLSKGFAYIEFGDMASTRKALKSDRMKIGGRPCFISEINKKVGFKFKTSVEKNKLFVSNLDMEVDENQLKEAFSKYGQLKDVRIVTYRNGHSKGRAYVEYTDELGASNGLKADGLLLGNKNIKVEISNPTRAGMKSAPDPVRTLGSSTMFGESGYVFSTKPLKLFLNLPTILICRRKRIDAPMIPSSVRRQQLKNGVSSGLSEPKAGPSMSNNQFRELLR